MMNENDHDDHDDHDCDDCENDVKLNTMIGLGLDEVTAQNGCILKPMNDHEPEYRKD